MIDVLSDLFILRGIPGHIRSDNWNSSRLLTSSAANAGNLAAGLRRARPRSGLYVERDPIPYVWLG
jgi:hypothetical protein